MFFWKYLIVVLQHLTCPLLLENKANECSICLLHKNHFFSLCLFFIAVVLQERLRNVPPCIFHSPTPGRASVCTNTLFGKKGEVEGVSSVKQCINRPPFCLILIDIRRVKKQTNCSHVLLQGRCYIGCPGHACGGCSLWIWRRFV